MMNKYKWAQYRSGAIKALNTLDNAMKLYQQQDNSGIECGFWVKNPYSEYTICADSECSSRTLPNGDPLPSDFYGYDSDCNNLLKFLMENLNIVKKCSNNAYENDCIPKYDGVDTIYKNKNPNKTDEDMAQFVKDYTTYKQDSILSRGAFVTGDGMIFAPLNNWWNKPTMLVDINGQKGPNKWGHDIVFFQGRIKKRYELPTFYPVNDSNLVDKGGMTTYKLIYGKDVLD